nr:hypothetical protein [Actinoplanes derwentensis]
MDRRKEPSFGYRAVHVVLFVERLPVEVQVRTDLQHRWAEVIEKLGDRWGRGLRHGDGVAEPERIAVTSGDGHVTRAAFLAEVQSLGDRLDGFEQLGLEISQLAAAIRTPDPKIKELHRRARTVESGLRDRLQMLLGQCDCDEMG